MTRTTYMAWGIAIAVSAFACSNNASNKFPAGDAARTGTSGGAAASATDVKTPPVTLVGCLQKGDGRSDYILTEVNSTPTTVGTTGSTPAQGSAADVVGQEQMRAAAHAYRLSGDRDNLEPLVGRQVRVTGMLAKSSDLNAHDASGKIEERDRTKIDEGDLAKVDVTTVDSVAENCGGSRRQ